jgi:hypothetical protein
MQRLALCLPLFLALGCNQTLGRPDRDGAASPDAGVRVDTGVPSTDAGGVDGTIDPDVDAAIVRGAMREDICGNLFDDDDDGIIDDGCDCAVGTERPCWLGPPDARDVGACHDGIQHCNSDGATAAWSYCLDQVTPGVEILDNGMDDDCDGTIDEADGICVPLSNDESGADCANGRDDDCDTRTDCDDPACVGTGGCPGACGSNEALCWGDHDDDCDGDVDCDDTDCAADASCETGPCPPGQTPTYRARPPSASYGASYIAPGDGNAIMPMTCEEGPCASGNVAVVSDTGALSCVPPPPDCPAGNSPTYLGGGRWRCDPPCDLRIHYGSIYGGLTVCAGRPPPDPCPSGQSWTFVYETQTWECRITCMDTLYDRIFYEGALLCVPC